MTATTTVNTASDRRMPGWLKGSLLAALVVAACWAGVITYWRATDRVPAPADLVLYLLALPLALIMASGFARARINKPAATPGTPPQPQPAPGINAQPLVLLAAALRSPHGESPEALSAAIIDNKARSDLDPELVDDDGFPVMTVRTRDTADEALQEEITEWWNANGIPQPGLSDHQWRAMTMATAVAGELACAAASDLMPAEGPPPMLQLHPIVPQEWHIDQRRAARMWLKHTVAQFGWPPAYIVLADEQQETALAALLGRLATDTVSGAPLAALIVACASNISEETVAQWSANASLFTSARPHGLIPGEGAAGLLVTDMQQAAALEDVVFTLLDTVVEARRDVSADDARRTDSTLLAALAERALKDSGVKLSDVAMLVADTGHRSNRVLELMGFASGAMPQLDGVDDVVRVGSASGTCGAVPFITALALGRHHALERAAPVLCVSNEDSYQRRAAIIRPYASA